jgi:hypothetical protein
VTTLNQYQEGMRGGNMRIRPAARLASLGVQGCV